MNSKQKHFWLYVLRLKNEKWYVGITTKEPKVRFLEHRENTRSAAWTRLHKPIELYDSISLGAVTEKRAKGREDNVTLEYMRKYGINNVRGGDYSEVESYVIKGRNFFRKKEYEIMKSGVIGMFLMFLLLITAVILGKLD